MKTVLGAGYGRYIPPETADYQDRLNFLAAWARGNKIVASGDNKAMLEVGTNGWTLPIPIVKTAAGWKFDIKATPAELQTRRIGRNELAAIQTVLAVADAQEEFYAANPDGRAVKHFAQRAVSTPGKRDGLYWPSAANAPESPLGPAFADVRPGQAYHGYRYHVLTEQGKDAPGGARSYLRNGLMTEGVCLGCLAGALRRHGGDDLHPQSRRHGLPEESGACHRRGRAPDEGLQPGRELAEGGACQVAV